MKNIPVIIFLSFCFCTKAQNVKPQLQVYAAPGFFFEQLSSDSLVPPEKRRHSRLGDISSFALQAAVPLKNQRWLIKAGAGFSQRHYSLSKYSIGDFITSLFLFDSRLRRDSFAISYVRFTNNYFQIPVSFAYMLNKPGNRFHLYTGLNLRADFLAKSKAEVRFDSSYKIPDAPDISAAQKVYTANATKFVFTVEPYIEGSFALYKKFGTFIQFRPFSFYSSQLDKKLTTSTGELLSFTFGASYSLK